MPDDSARKQRTRRLLLRAVGFATAAGSVAACGSSESGLVAAEAGVTGTLAECAGYPPDAQPANCREDTGVHGSHVEDAGLLGRHAAEAGPVGLFAVDAGVMGKVVVDAGTHAEDVFNGTIVHPGGDGGA